jgi:O-acetyl-ADP-ribose deacetylase (regulator of RNase III)
MIYQVEGDILLTGAQAIAHGVSPNDHFDSGLALGLREQWPSMAKDFRHYAHLTHPKPGEIWTWGGVGGKKIINLMTQEGEHAVGSKPGRASISNVAHCLKRLQHEIDVQGIKSIALPKLATGAGGLKWSEVEKVVSEYLGDLKIPVYVYTTYAKGKKGNEPA